MSGWEKEELAKIATTDDLHISPLRDDGRTYGTPTWIWSVVVNDPSLRSRLQRTKISLVPSRATPKSRQDHGSWNDHLRDF